MIQTSERYNGIIKFFSSDHKYHLVYTCNTWIADALETAGLNVNSSVVIRAEELFTELTKCGKLLKIGLYKE